MPNQTQNNASVSFSVRHKHQTECDTRQCTSHP